MMKMSVNLNILGALFTTDFTKLHGITSSEKTLGFRRLHTTVLSNELELTTQAVTNRPGYVPE
jgi:hypothetical protein